MDIGAQLRAAREAKGLSIGTLAARTRVPARALAAIELNDHLSLPPHPFGRGFVRTYAEEVSLDPDRLVQDYFAQFPAPAAASVPVARNVLESSWQPSSGWMGMATAVAILLVVVAAAVVLGRRSDNTEPATVGTTGQSAGTLAPTATASKPVANPAGVQPAPAGAPPPARPESRALTVIVSMSRPCWIAATVDGRRTIYRIVQPGDRQTLVGERDIAIRFGDAGAVTWTINGRDAGAPGADGAVRDIRITTENAASVR